MSVRVVLVGCGGWGQNLLRVLARSPRAELVAVVDPVRERLASAHDYAPRARTAASLEDALALAPDAAVIATPPATHVALALLALEAGVDVFVEKPLALSPAEADLCAARALALGRIGMVGHLLRYHPTLAKLAALAHEGDLGDLRRLTAARLSASGDRASPALWTLGPHDLSVVRALDAGPVASIAARPIPGADGVSLELCTDRGFEARIELSRSHPIKERRISVVGSERVALFDDVRAPDTLVLGKLVRGDVFDPSTASELHVPWREPLAEEIDHFLGCVEERRTPRTPLEEGACVVRLLARAEAAASDCAPSRRTSAEAR